MNVQQLPLLQLSIRPSRPQRERPHCPQVRIFLKTKLGEAVDMVMRNCLAAYLSMSRVELGYPTNRPNGFVEFIHAPKRCVPLVISCAPTSGKDDANLVFTSDHRSPKPRKNQRKRCRNPRGSSASWNRPCFDAEIHEKKEHMNHH